MPGTARTHRPAERTGGPGPGLWTKSPTLIGADLNGDGGVTEACGELPTVEGTELARALARALAVVDQVTWNMVQQRMIEAGYLGEAETFDRWRRIGVQASEGGPDRSK